MIDKTITLIRHGKTSGNYEKRYVGITDEQMTMEGEREIHIRKYPEEWFWLHDCWKSIRQEFPDKPWLQAQNND